MHTMKNDSITYKTLLLAGVTALGIACGDSGTTTTDAGSTGDTSSNTTSGATTTTAGTGEPTTGATDSGSTTHTTHTTHMHTSTSDDSTTDVSTTGTSTGHETHSTTDHTGSTTEDVSSTTAGGDPPPVEDYCACMLGECHDQYHDKWGEDHEAAEMMCVAFAEALPTVGMPAMSGNSIECYYWACTAGDCESALGGGACM